MILQLKRLAAKVIDVVLFFVTGFIFLLILTFLVTLVFSNFIDMKADFIVWLQNAPTDDLISFTAYLEAQTNLFILFGFIGTGLLLIYGFVYFALLGRLVHGSLGKYVFQLYLEDANGTENILLVRLFLREPIIHLLVWGLFISTLGLLLPPLKFLSGIPYYTYLIMFIFNHDFWNQWMKIKFANN